MSDTLESTRFRAQPPALDLRLRGVAAGLGTAFCFTVSSVFVRAGMEGLPSPLLGVTIGVVVNMIVYGLFLLVHHRVTRAGAQAIPRNTLRFQSLAGLLLAFAMWAHYTALDGAPVGIVVALGRLSVPVVLVLAPILVGQQWERVTPRVWAGALLIIGGSALLLLSE